MRIVSMLTIGHLAALLTSACSPATSSEPPSAADAGESDSATISCRDDSRRETYAPNLEKAGTAGLFRFTLVSASPAPPVRGTNTWSLRVTDSGGATINGATIEITPYMPDHGHGTSVNASASEQGDHSYTIAPLYFFMPGLWQITFKATLAGQSDTAVFTFCVEG